MKRKKQFRQTKFQYNSIWADARELRRLLIIARAYIPSPTCGMWKCEHCERIEAHREEIDAFIKLSAKLPT